jgi:predicted DNA-binding protein (MmcQ/YjbR family)
MPSPLPRLRKLCLSLPETHEVEAWGAPTFRIKGGKIFAMYASASNQHAGRHSVWIKARKDNQELMIRSKPARFFKPPYVGPSGWIGVYLDKSPDWNEVAELLRDGWRQIAPRKLLASIEQQAAPGKPRPRKSAGR